MNAFKKAIFTFSGLCLLVAAFAATACAVPLQDDLLYHLNNPGEE